MFHMTHLELNFYKKHSKIGQNWLKFVFSLCLLTQQKRIRGFCYFVLIRSAVHIIGIAVAKILQFAWKTKKKQQNMYVKVRSMNNINLKQILGHVIDYVDSIPACV